MFARGSLFDNCKIVPILSYASGTADRSSEVFDTKGYGRGLIIVHFATIAAGAVTNLFVQTADAASNETTLTSGADLAGSSQTIADDADNTVKYIDFKPTRRFGLLTLNKDATNATAESAVLILYQAKSKPTTHGLGTSTIGEGAGAVVGENLGEAAQGDQ
jgi:hypothetical protein